MSLLSVSVALEALSDFLTITHSYSDSLVERCTPLPISCTDCRTPLLLHPSPLYKDTLGAAPATHRLVLFSQVGGRTVWRNIVRKGIYICAFHFKKNLTPVVG